MRIFGLKIDHNETNHHNNGFAVNASIGVFSKC